MYLDGRLSSGIFKNQITTLVIAVDRSRKDLSTMENICNLIFTVFTNLTHLIFCESSYSNIIRLLFEYPSPSFYSSTLLVLSIKVQNFDICLYILDGRFKQLHTLYIDLNQIYRPPEEIENQVKIPNLKWFFLSCASETMYYNELILPLLYRMSNLEKLGLDLSVFVHERFIDGNNLKTNILNHMSNLNYFSFHICSCMFINNEMNLPSKQDVQQTFRDFKDNQIISYVDYFLERKQGQCHIYSYPSIMKYFDNITNNFPGGLYPYVRVVSLYDEYPFEHEFFIQIAQSFPRMEQLTLINHHAQKYKQSYKSMNDNQNSSIVKYWRLIRLNMLEVHDDYIEEFLFHTKTYLYNNILLDIKYKSLERVTHNFTRNDTQHNCTKINEIYLFGATQYSISLKNYFPFAKIH
ncbi:unnamed protein product [Rotaria sp. Silwood2]|nr:unnamed protein product [Rotaria sp. Silwood2]CAF2989232.1 unnamed protein product [Rotaria sp. Silwood2]CAF4381797.1 unnamed protein product [Rotaria sp. Silwood2]CAF4399445.1 unnamed protein product [Rotaria sp. Silwood2]